MTTQLADRERRPIVFGWRRVPTPADFPIQGVPLSIWVKGRTTVLSTLSSMEYPTGGGVGPTWQISVSDRSDAKKAQVRPAHISVRQAINAFEMGKAEEDNHHPGVARHFFLAVDPAHRVDCECKTSETVVREAGGYAWTNPKSGKCRGCEWAAMRRGLGYKDLCPIHREDTRP